MAVAFQSIATAATDGGGTSLAVNVPGGTVDGDLLVLGAFAPPASVVTLSGDAALTQIRATNDETVFRQMKSFYRVASSEPASYTFSITGGTNRDLIAFCARFTGQHASAFLDAHGGQANTTASTSVTSPSITTTVDNCLLVYFGANTSSGTPTFTAPGGMTERADWGSINSPVGSANFGCVATETFGAAGATGTRVATATTSDRSIGQLIAIAPAAVTTRLRPHMRYAMSGGMQTL